MGRTSGRSPRLQLVWRWTHRHTVPASPATQRLRTKSDARRGSASGERTLAQAKDGATTSSGSTAGVSRSGIQHVIGRRPTLALREFATQATGKLDIRVLLGQPDSKRPLAVRPLGRCRPSVHPWAEETEALVVGAEERPPLWQR